MIDAIYKEIANKELSFWCVVSIKSTFAKQYNNKTHRYNQWEKWRFVSTWIYRFNKYWVEKWIKVNIIGHQVMIGDVLDWVDKKDIPFEMVEWCFTRRWYILLKIDDLRENKRKTIEEQPIECIAYIYSLLHTNTDDTTK